MKGRDASLLLHQIEEMYDVIPPMEKTHFQVKLLKLSKLISRPNFFTSLSMDPNITATSYAIFMDVVFGTNILQQILSIENKELN